MGYDIISLDLDGTLVDSAAEITEAANRALESHGIARRPADEVVRHIGHGTRELMLRLLARAYLEQPALADRVRVEPVLASMDRHYAAAIGTAARPYEGARSALQALQGAGVRLACVSNKDAHHARRVLQACRLDRFFVVVIGGDSLPQKKPHAGVLRHVVEQLRGEPRRMAHVGDSAIDVEAAHNAGVAAWAVPYGYNGGVPVEAARPDRLFANLMVLADYVIASRRRQSVPPGASLVDSGTAAG